MPALRRAAAIAGRYSDASTGAGAPSHHETVAAVSLGVGLGHREVPGLVEAEHGGVQGMTILERVRTVEQQRQRAVLGGAVDALRAAFDQALGGGDDPLDRVTERAVELVPRRCLAGAAQKPAADAVPLVASCSVRRAATCSSVSPQTGGSSLSAAIARIRAMPAARPGQSRPLNWGSRRRSSARKPCEVVDHAALVALERLELDGLLVGYHCPQLAHEVARVGAHPVELGRDVIEQRDELGGARIAALGLGRERDQRVEQLGELGALERADPLGQIGQSGGRPLGDLAGRRDVVGEAACA